MDVRRQERNKRYYEKNQAKLRAKAREYYHTNRVYREADRSIEKMIKELAYVKQTMTADDIVLQVFSSTFTPEDWKLVEEIAINQQQ